MQDTTFKTESDQLIALKREVREVLVFAGRRIGQLRKRVEALEAEVGIIPPKTEDRGLAAALRASQPELSVVPPFAFSKSEQTTSQTQEIEQ